MTTFKSGQEWTLPAQLRKGIVATFNQKKVEKIIFPSHRGNENVGHFLLHRQDIACLKRQ